MRSALAFAAVLAVGVSGCGEPGSGDREPAEACTLRGCGAAVVVDLPALEAEPRERIEIEACVGGRCGSTRLVAGEAEQATAGIHLELPEGKAGSPHQLTVTVGTADGRRLAEASGRIPLSASHPNGRGCGECRSLRARLLEDGSTLVPAQGDDGWTSYAPLPD